MVLCCWLKRRKQRDEAESGHWVNGYWVSGRRESHSDVVVPKSILAREPTRSKSMRSTARSTARSATRSTARSSRGTGCRALLSDHTSCAAAINDAARAVGLMTPPPHPTSTCNGPFRQPDAGANMKFDCFLSHDCDNDAKGRDNHSRVLHLQKALQDQGVVAAVRMGAQDHSKMVRQIETSRVMLVCITTSYMEYVDGRKQHPEEGCKEEFWHGIIAKGAHSMIPVIMEPRCRRPGKWRGNVGRKLGRSPLFIQLHDDGNAFFDGVQLLADEIKDLTGSLLSTPVPLLPEKKRRRSSFMLQLLPGAKQASTTSDSSMIQSAPSPGPTLTPSKTQDRLMTQSQTKASVGASTTTSCPGPTLTPSKTPSKTQDRLMTQSQTKASVGASTTALCPGPTLAQSNTHCHPSEAPKAGVTESASPASKATASESKSAASEGTPFANQSAIAATAKARTSIAEHPVAADRTPEGTLTSAQVTASPAKTSLPQPTALPPVSPVSSATTASTSKEAAEWHYVGADGKPSDKLATEEELLKLLKSGGVKPSTLVWKSTMQAWAPISAVPELKGSADAAWHYVNAKGVTSSTLATEWELQKLLTKGALTPEALVWKQGMASWTAISAVAELAHLVSKYQAPRRKSVVLQMGSAIADMSLSSGPTSDSTACSASLTLQEMTAPLAPAAAPAPVAAQRSAAEPAAVETSAVVTAAAETCAAEVSAAGSPASAAAEAAAVVTVAVVPSATTVEAAVWRYVDAQGRAERPVTAQHLQQLLLAGTISTSTLVWKSNMAAWTMLSEVPELESLKMTARRNRCSTRRMSRAVLGEGGSQVTQSMRRKSATPADNAMLPAGGGLASISKSSQSTTDS